MQENTTRLVDEALIYEPVKNTFLLGWEWIVINKEFTAMALGIYILFNMVGVSFLATIFTIMLQIYIGRIFYTSGNITTFIDTIKASNREKFLKETVAPAMGAYLGWTVLMFLVGLIVVLFISTVQDLSTLQLETLQSAEDIEANMKIIEPLLMALGIPSLLMMLLLLYIKPLVEANITMSHTFKEGFLAVFSSFSFDLWRKVMRSDYFIYVLKLDFILMVMFLPIVFVVSLIGLNILTYSMILVFLYMVNIMMAIGSMMLRRMVE